ncbi:uncharacterized protein [Periplaneta americana]|uniref:uncharacterized protein isoform X2 n=1 Tax=Periplaneta americana TaxID=6978 RepID=UPI0037E9A47B
MFRLPIRLLHAALRFDFMLLIRNFPTRSQKEDFNTSVTFCCHDCHVNCHLIYRRVAYMMCVFSLIDLYNHWFASFVQVSASHWMSVQISKSTGNDTVMDAAYLATTASEMCDNFVLLCHSIAGPPELAVSTIQDYHEDVTQKSKTRNRFPVLWNKVKSLVHTRN